MKYEFEIVTIHTTAYLPPAAVWYDLDDGWLLGDEDRKVDVIR